MSRLQRELKLTQMIDKISKDIAKMEKLLPVPLIQNHGSFTQKESESRDYLYRQITKYLKPHGSVEFLKDIKLLKTVFSANLLVNGKDDDAIPGKRPNWDTEGLGLEHEPWKFKLGGGWAQSAGFAGKKIRINQKAFWLFPELTLRGVMVHEATHFTLDTTDTYYSSFHQNSTLKNLADGNKNADNWRIFYQKMSHHFASGATAE